MFPKCGRGPSESWGGAGPPDPPQLLRPWAGVTCVNVRHSQCLTLSRNVERLISGFRCFLPERDDHSRLARTESIDGMNESFHIKKDR